MWLTYDAMMPIQQDHMLIATHNIKEMSVEICDEPVGFPFVRYLMLISARSIAYTCYDELIE